MIPVSAARFSGPRDYDTRSSGCLESAALGLCRAGLTTVFARRAGSPEALAGWPSFDTRCILIIESGGSSPGGRRDKMECRRDGNASGRFLQIAEQGKGY